MSNLNLFIFVFGVCNVLSTNAAPCKIEDAACMQDAVISILKTTFDGVPEIGIEPLDPSSVDTIDASFPSMQILLKNITGSGLGKCETKEVRVDSDTLEFDILCPSLMLTSSYTAKGQVLIIPVYGQGEVFFKSGRITATVICKHKKQKKSDGKNHWHISVVDVKPEALDPIEFDITNLFNGQKELSDGFLKFAHENWKMFSELLLPQIMKPGMKVAMKKVNKYLEKKKTYEDTFLN